MYFSSDDLLKIALAIGIGGLIGIEREFRDKAAGFRTLIFICAGAALFTIFSSKLAGDNDHTRIAANIVTGVGFLGAGVIMRDGGRVFGLTTASTIWLTAALGMGIGGGEYALTGISTALMLVVLWFFPKIEFAIDNAREERTYEIVCPFGPDKLIDLENTFQKSGLQVRSHRQVKSDEEMVCSWQASGSIKAHESLIKHLFADKEVKELRY